MRISLCGAAIFTAALSTLLSAQEEVMTNTPPAKREFRLSTSSPAAGIDGEDSKSKDIAVSPPELPEGALKVGIVEGKSKLPAELTELAQKGAAAVAAQDWKLARDAYLEMVKEVPDNALAYANLGVAEFQIGNLLAASGNLARSLEINPSIAENWQTLGLIHYRRGELNLAISNLTRAIHEDPRNARSRLYLSAVIRDNGWPEAALTELERAVQIDPELADAHFNLAVTYLEAKPPLLELARRHYHTARDLGAEASPEIEAILASQVPLKEGEQ